MSSLALQLRRLESVRSPLQERLNRIDNVSDRLVLTHCKTLDIFNERFGDIPEEDLIIIIANDSVYVDDDRYRVPEFKIPLSNLEHVAPILEEEELLLSDLECVNLS